LYWNRSHYKIREGARVDGCWYKLKYDNLVSASESLRLDLIKKQNATLDV
jgi:hypothetical protein